MATDLSPPLMFPGAPDTHSLAVFPLREALNL
jgi:hypothetical protein